MSTWIECNRCATILPLDGGEDAAVAREAQSKGWTIVGRFGAKRTRCPDCRRRQRFWHVKGSKVRHHQRRCISLVGKQRIPGPPTMWPKKFARRTREPAKELNAQAATGLKDCRYCGDVP